MALDIVYMGTEELVKEHEEMESYLTETEEEAAMADRRLFEASLAGHISYIYTQNKDARRDSGIEQEMLDGMDAYNGTILWSLEIPDLERFNMPRDCGNWCADDDFIYAAIKE